jgi:hypothetical protein
MSKSIRWRRKIKWRKSFKWWSTLNWSNPFKYRTIIIWIWRIIIS